jgi:Reverse transcriptase (RNA-dependent DNA polymerase)
VARHAPDAGCLLAHRRVQIVLYADDMLVVGKSAAELRMVAAAIAKYLATFGLSLSAAKSKHVTHSNMASKVLIGGEAVPHAAAVTYLGMTLAKTGFKDTKAGK